MPERRVALRDYGCGQGLSTMLFLDALRATRAALPMWLHVEGVTLIEPSTVALERARRLIELYEVHVQSVATTIDKFIVEAVRPPESGVVQVHILSNIIDIENFSLENLVPKMFAAKGRHLVLGVSPDRSFSGGCQWAGVRIASWAAKLIGVAGRS